MIELEVALFDKDGVYVDSERSKGEAMARAVKELNNGALPEDFNEWYASRVGVSGIGSCEMFVSHYGLPIEPENLYQTTEGIRKDMLDREPAIIIEPSVRLINSLHGKLRIGVGSSDFPVHIESHNRQAGIDGVVSAYVSGEKGSGDVTPGNDKPHPECYLVLATRLQVDPAACVGFEDTDFGMQALRDANVMLRIGHNNPSSGKQDLLSNGAHAVVDDLSLLSYETLVELHRSVQNHRN